MLGSWRHRGNGGRHDPFYRTETEAQVNTRIYAGLAVATVAVGLGATLWKITADRAADPYAQCRAGQVAGGDIGGPFTLVDNMGRTVTETDVITHPTLVYFGYTYCPDVCPLDNLRNAEAVDLLESRGIEATPVFVSVDPARDTPEVMNGYVGDMHPRMVGLTGSADQVAAAVRAYKVYSAIPPSQGEFYLVDHSTFTYLMIPGRGFVDFFRRETTAAEMADRVACYVGRG